MATRKKKTADDGGAAKAPRAPRAKKAKAAAAPRGLEPAEVAAGAPPPALRELVAAVAADGGTVVGTWRDPLGGLWQALAVLPIAAVEPTPFQRDLSPAHVDRLALRIDQLGRFLDPIIAVRRPDGRGYWTPNGNHRLHALRALACRSITALLVPEPAIAYQILALNTEKAHNLREKALEVVRMARDLAALPGARSERDHAAHFEDPELLTLGVCYEQNGRFAGGVWRSVLRRLVRFSDAPLAAALAEHERRAAALVALDAAVAEAVARLKAQGLESPYLKNFVVGRINPLRFQKDTATVPDFDATLAKMLAAAQKFDAKKVGADQVAAAGGAGGGEE